MELKKASLEDRKLLGRLMQLYLHDLCLYFPLEIANDGIYYYDDFDEYFSMNRLAYLFYDNDKIVGFCLIDISDELNSFQEMFILNNYKHRGYGREAVCKIFDMYPGAWIVKAVPNSRIAEEFWDTVISLYTNNNYILEHTGKYNRAEFSFSNK